MNFQNLKQSRDQFKVNLPSTSSSSSSSEDDFNVSSVKSDIQTPRPSSRHSNVYDQAKPANPTVASEPSSTRNSLIAGLTGKCLTTTAGR